MKRIWKFLTSLKLTVVLLALGIILVFVGTVAQADEGLYQAQARYFKHWWVFGINFFGHHVPIPLPGGYLLGTALLVNLTAAHIQRFQWSWKKIGIHLTHAGIVILLVGQLVTDLFSNETHLHFYEGEAKNYSESAAHYELVFIRDVGDGTEEVVSIPDHLLAKGKEIQNGALPFTVRAKTFWKNSEPSFRAPMQQNIPPMTTNGIAQHFDFRSSPDVKTMDGKNVPSSMIEIATPHGSFGEWVVSGWAGDNGMAESVDEYYRRNMGAQMADKIIGYLMEPQTIVVGGKQFTFTIRPTRVYTPYSLSLIKATHTVYPGTDTPKDFRSRVRIENPQTGENREAEIFMNSPLRYAGVTFYQYQMGAQEAAVAAGQTPWSRLEVVRNPGWLTPYAGCIIVALGLVTQFMIHLVGFISKRKAA